MSGAPEVRVGQVYRDNDPRGASTFRVTRLTSAYAVVESVGERPNRRQIRLDRLRRGGCRGYTLVTDVPSVADWGERRHREEAREQLRIDVAEAIESAVSVECLDVGPCWVDGVYGASLAVLELLTRRGLLP